LTDQVCLLTAPGRSRGETSETARPSASGRIAECSIYVAGEARGRGIGTDLCRQLAEEATGRSLWKLVGKIFPENLACVRLVGRCGFREVGLHHRHGRLDGEWRDVLLVERLLGEPDRAAAGEG
jgi:L-amino acid N-acyltransferase YncA